jgi:uncharacterized protein involved in response to NO
MGLPKEDTVHALTTGAVPDDAGGDDPRQPWPYGTSQTRRSHHGLHLHAGYPRCITESFGPITDIAMTSLPGLAAVCWSGAYVLFAVVYGPFLLRPSLEE